ncbi:hypothetical protein AQUCO_00200495v1 [Aquilegia coerulea]|uniref:Uncharacterized protein n=1 Tax=Aquilegia coerulea TaxID=218851 RepID=A0A2G5F3J9_AQUCA|nr:hypothetical protein AQUCO_00200495v1 [Aquilegia coerulea]
MSHSSSSLVSFSQVIFLQKIGDASVLLGHHVIVNGKVQSIIVLLVTYFILFHSLCCVPLSKAYLTFISELCSRLTYKELKEVYHKVMMIGLSIHSFSLQKVLAESIKIWRNLLSCFFI